MELTEGKPERVLDYFVVVGLDPEVVPLETATFGGDDFGGSGGRAELQLVALNEEDVVEVEGVRFRSQPRPQNWGILSSG